MQNGTAKLLKILLVAAILLPVIASGQALTKKQQDALDKLVRQSPVFAKMFTGFALYDPAGKINLYQKDADKYYTPASNTKIFTLYTGLRVLGDSLPVLRYSQQAPFTVLQGLGYPLLFHPDFALAQDQKPLNFLRSVTGPLAFSSENFKDTHFGNGWNWQDYQYSYQAEKGSLPLYGNIARFKVDSLRQEWKAYPKYFLPLLSYDPKLVGTDPDLYRDQEGPLFHYNKACLTPRKNLVFELPFNYSPQTVADVLSDTLKRKIHSWDDPTEIKEMLVSGPISVGSTDVKPANVEAVMESTRDVVAASWKTLSVPMPDTMLRLFMQESDNFLAEQLLLMSSAKQLGYLKTPDIIDYSLKNLLKDLPDAPVWMDGSGLSRQNLFTPRDLVFVLEKLYREYPQNRLFGLFPAGGVSGTIKNWYPGKKGIPYVFAKTGTLSNNNCLSGYLRTNTGRILIFSFMHNHYLGGASPIRQEMQKVLEWMRDNL
jgi:D-alanyl-D-alanine carboxypeptidase/D-alanyl-D-alanine-endopeptidase (penicillin-binding protein 4)